MARQTGDLLRSRYRIEAELGAGGMGTVYRALDTTLDVPCAVKRFELGFLPSEAETRISPDGASEERRKDGSEPSITRENAIELFREEARLLARLSHPGLPKVTDFFDEDHSYWLVMTFIEGETLEQVQTRTGGGPLAEQEVLEWTHQVADALAYCHSEGVVHRDVKPGNMILTPKGRVFLADFGIAKPSPESKTLMVAVSPGYSPLEQYDDTSPTDERTDIYALGATMYRLLTGQEVPTANERALGTEVPEPAKMVNVVSAGVSQAVMKAMALRPGDRFQSVTAMSKALAAAEAEDHVHTRWIWVALLAAFIALMAVACGGLYLVWQSSPPSLPPMAEATSTLSTGSQTGVATVTPMPIVSASETPQLVIPTPMPEPKNTAGTAASGTATTVAIPSPTVRPTDIATSTEILVTAPAEPTVTTLPASTTPEATEPVEAPSAGKVLAVVLPGSGASVRDVPQRNAVLIATLEKGDELVVLGRHSHDPWVKVQTIGSAPRIEGWVRVEQISMNALLDSIPVVGPDAVVSTPKAATDTATVLPEATPEAAPQLEAPVLVAPFDRQAFTHRDEVVLRWESAESLAEDEYYVVSVAYTHLGETWFDDVPWTRTAQWTMSEHVYLLELSDDGEFRWSVSIMRKMGDDAQGKPQGVPRSLRSEERVLIWKEGDSGGEAPGPDH